jgi:hypothetical protein
MVVLAAAAAMVAFAALAGADDEAPRLGRYEVRSAPIPAGTVINILILDTESAYTLYDSIGAVLIGRGEYRFNPNPSAGESHYIWQSGPLRNRNYTGTLYIENGGRTHRIQLEPQTYAITVDGPVWRPQ